MNTYRKTAITVGILFIVCTVASILGPSLASSINAPDYLNQLAGNPNQIIIAALLEFIWAAAGAGIWRLDSDAQCIGLNLLAVRHHILRGVYGVSTTVRAPRTTPHDLQPRHRAITRLRAFGFLLAASLAGQIGLTRLPAECRSPVCARGQPSKQLLEKY